MKLFGINFSRRSPDARTHEVVAQSPAAQYDMPRLAARSLRRGMWVFKHGFPRAGILTGLNSNDVATVMLVQEDGTNFMEVNALASTLRQAAISEIPAARRKLPDASFEAMGYRRQP